jgi:hypothetical protein
LLRQTRTYHNLLPFSELLSAGVGIRSASIGYGDDSVRQKFGKERDETWLDYFLARYYASTQGRFTSPDEFKGGPHELFILESGSPTKQAPPFADITNPQSLNKYYKQACKSDPLTSMKNRPIHKIDQFMVESGPFYARR